MSKRVWSIDSLVLIFSFIVIAQLLSYAIPHGSFERVPVADDPSRSVVVDGTYARGIFYWQLRRAWSRRRASYS